nr:chitin deacetylase 8-like [Hydra vulgaris]
MPISPWMNEDGSTCITFDQCLKKTKSAQEVYKVIMNNFKKHYNDNKQPFPIFSISNWFGQSNEVYRIEGLSMFIDEVQKLPDVYFVTVSQAIEWTKNPIPLNKNPWQC